MNVRILGDEKRFGFSVMGGTDEGFAPRIDDISEGVIQFSSQSRPALSTRIYFFPYLKNSASTRSVF